MITSLVILFKEANGYWMTSRSKNPTWNVETEYFLVPEKHLEVALYWLNGGTVQLKQASANSWWTYVREEGDEPAFLEEYEYRIKPKTEKVKVWVVLRKDEAFPAPLYSVVDYTTMCEGYTWTQVEVDKEV